MKTEGNEPLDAEIVPQDTMLQRRSMAGEVLSMQGEIDPVQLEKIAQQRIEFFRKVTLLSLRRTTVNDWCDQGGKPYLQATGAEKLLALWGITTHDVKIHIEMDEGTGFPAYEVTGRVGSRVLGTEMDVIGGRNANDKFYQDQLSATGRLDLLDVRKAAYSNWLVNAITRIIGMRGLTWEDVSTATNGAITKETCAGKIKYKNKDKTQEQTQAQPTQQSNQGPPQQNGTVISEAQGKRFYAIAKGGGWQDQEIKDYLKREYGIEHSRDIKRADYDAICKAMEEGAGS